MPSSSKRHDNQTISEIVTLMHLYSASKDDLEMVLCFCTFQKTSELPILMQKPKTDFLVST